MENPVMQGLSVAFELIVLNILTILAAFPVVTAGASVTALFDVTGRMVRSEDLYTARTFMRSLRQNMRKGVVLGLLFIVAAILIALNYAAASRFIPVLRFASLAIALLVTALGIYAFGLTARFENSIALTLKNAAMLTVGFFPRTVILVVFTLCFYLLAMRFPQVGMPMLMLFGLSVPAYVYALVCRPVFDSLTDRTE